MNRVSAHRFDTLAAVPADGLRDLIAFGQAADASRRHSILAGGFIAPERPTPKCNSRGKEHNHSHVGEDAGTEGVGTQPRQGRQAQAPTAGAETHPLERGLEVELGLGELFDYHSDSWWRERSSSSALLVVPVGLFRALPYRAFLGLELPRTRVAWAERAKVGLVPFIRAWGIWAAGILIDSYHSFPDGSICSCLPQEWRPGVHLIEDYVGFCICWIAKCLHLQLLGRWPGPQHCPPGVLVARNRPDEFCHCGAPRRYKECHMEEDAERSGTSLSVEAFLGRRAYLAELERKGLDRNGPFRWDSHTPIAAH